MKSASAIADILDVFIVFKCQTMWIVLYTVLLGAGITHLYCPHIRVFVRSLFERYFTPEQAVRADAKNYKSSVWREESIWRTLATFLRLKPSTNARIFKSPTQTAIPLPIPRNYTETM